jgi:hypothetical protein
MRPLALAVLLALALPAHAQMYKCVDARGVTHYTDKPLPGCKGGPVNIRGQPPLAAPAAPAPGAPEKPAAQAEVAKDDADFKRRQIEREQAEQREKSAAAERCTILRQEQSFLSQGGRIGKLNEKGERVYMDDAARDARLAAVREELRACP